MCEICEKYLTIKEAAARLNLKYYQLQRAVKKGLIPSYRLYNSRRLVRISDIVAFMKASNEGGCGL